MTESGWWGATDPRALVDWLFERGITERKGRLFSLACCRKVEKHFPTWPAASLLPMLEAYADNQVDSAAFPKEIDSGWDDELAYKTWTGPPPWAFADAVLEAALGPRSRVRVISDADGDVDVISRGSGPASVVVHTNWAFRIIESEPSDPATSLVPLLHDIFGPLPFRDIAVQPAWLTSDVQLLARGIYADKAFDRMPILADALQDAGCDNDDILTHCRAAHWEHVRGCWVIDLLLGRPWREERTAPS